MWRLLSSSALLHPTLGADCDVDQVSALQAKTQMMERASLDRDGEGLDRALYGKKNKDPCEDHTKPGCEHWECTWEKGDELLTNFNFGPDPQFSAEHILKGVDVDYTKLVADLSHQSLGEDCRFLRNNVGKMQSNPCWEKAINEVPDRKGNHIIGTGESAHKSSLFKETCDGTNKQKVMGLFTVEEMCKKSGAEICKAVHDSSELKSFFEKCDVECDVNIFEYYRQKGHSLTCKHGLNVASVEECRAAARLQKYHFKENKPSSKRPPGCYYMKYKGNRKMYWNPQPRKDFKKASGFKKRRMVCMKKRWHH